CTAMGFAHVVKHTGCDQHLIHLLLRPLKQVRSLLIPGAVLVGFIVNIPLVSQTSTAVTVGAVLVPLLLAAGFSPITVGAALLLGSSVGGGLLNPGAPELLTTVERTEKAIASLKLDRPTPTRAECAARILPLNLLNLAVAGGVFWWLSLRAEKKREAQFSNRPNPEITAVADKFQINIFFFVVGMVVLVLFFLSVE